MADGMTIHADTANVERMIQGLLDKVERPKALLRQVERYVNAVTKKMFRGRRPDRAPVRDVSWPPLAASTRAQKLNRIKRGKAGTDSVRPLVGSGGMRDSLRVLGRQQRGFLYGTRKRSAGGFPYPALHNKGGPRMPARPWLFLREHDFGQLTKMTVDFLEGKLRTFRGYAR